MRHIISILLQNEAGALSRVAGLFSARGYNIESLSVAPTDDPAVSRLTLVTLGSDDVVNQINKQVSKLIDVVDRSELTRRAHVERELLLIKVAADGQPLDDLLSRYQAAVIDDADELLVVQLVGTSLEIDDFMRELRSVTRIVEVVRSGVAAVASGEQVMAAQVA
ncbi:acetolactate synthase small subunit [bacterium]|nr:acetolactate synthase small subunit [bacterium]